MRTPHVLQLLAAPLLLCGVGACAPAPPPPVPVSEQSPQIALHPPEAEHPIPPPTPTVSATPVAPPPPAAAAPVAPPAAEGLRRSQWQAVEPGGPFTQMTFADSLATFGLADGSTVSLAADLSGAHPACLGLRFCALTPTGDGQLVRYLFVELGGLLSHADCESVEQHGDAWPLRHQELVQTHGPQVVVQEATIVCWQSGQPPYRAVGHDAAGAVVPAVPTTP